MPKVDVATDANPTFVVLVDLNGDGRLDIATANTNVATISLFTNATATGATTPDVGNAMPITVGLSPACIAFADLNGDGAIDLVTANVGASTASVLLNTTSAGAISFAPHTDFTTGANPEFVAVADFDGDGAPDFATADSTDSTVSVFRNTTPAHATTATFAARLALATDTYPISLASRDLDGDGRPDLVAVNVMANTLSVLGNTTPAAGPPTFASHVDLATGNVPKAIAIADLDGAGGPDLAVANAFADTVSVLRNITNNAVPAFAARVDVVTGAGPDGLVIADIDQDGRPDLVTADFSAGTASVLLATSSGYMPPEAYVTGPTPRAVAAGDLNGDGKVDLVVANGAANSISILLAR